MARTAGYKRFPWFVDPFFKGLHLDGAQFGLGDFR